MCWWFTYQKYLMLYLIKMPFENKSQTEKISDLMYILELSVTVMFYQVKNMMQRK